MSIQNIMSEIKEIKNRENYLRSVIIELSIPIGGEYPKNEQVAAYEAAIEIAADNGDLDMVNGLFEKMEDDYFDDQGTDFQRRSIFTALSMAKESDLKNKNVGAIINSWIQDEDDSNYTNTDFEFAIAYHNGYVDTCERLSDNLSIQMKDLLNQGLSDTLFDEMTGRSTFIDFNINEDNEELVKFLPTTSESYPFNDDCYNF